MKINKPLESKSIRESNDKEVIFQIGNKKIIKDGYGYGIEDDNNVTTNRFYVNDKGEPKFDDGTPNKFWLDKVNSLIKSGKLASKKTTNEAFEKDGGPFWYFTKHGLGPGMLPKGVNVVDTKEDDNFGTYIALDKVLSTQELKDYELKEKKPDVKEGYSHFEFTSGANPYIAKTKGEAERIKRSRGDSVRYVGNINGIDYYKVDDSEEKDLFSVDESFKPTESGIQSVKVYNPYNYTIQELRVDNDNKTFERGNFTAGKPDKKTKNRQEFEDVVDTLKELGYTEIKSDYRSLRNKTRKGVPTNESYWIENKEIMDKVSRLENQLDKEGWNKYNDKYSGSKYYSIFAKRGESGAEFKAVKYNHDHTPEIVDLTYKQVIGDEPLDSFDGLRRKLGKILLPTNESKESEESELITQYINNGEFDKLEKVHNGTNVVWKLKEPINEDVEVSDIAHYIIDNYEFDDMQDKYDCINSLRASFKFDKTISEEDIENFVGAHNGKDKVNESKSIKENSEGFQKEFYSGYVILKNRAGDGWDIYSYDGTPDKVTKSYLEDEGYATLKDAKAEIDRLNKESNSMNEASYGGAFDIADDQYFTREDLENAAEEVLNHINETFEEPYNLGGTWFEDGKWVVNVQDDGFNEYEVSVPVDMRKIREPWHLRRAYAGDVAAKLIAQIKEYNGLDEDTSVSSAFEFDDDVDELTYYYDDEEFRRELEEEPYNEIASKQVPDVDGFLTDYTMYQNMNTGEYVFVFGDKDVYRPEDGNFDWECETEEEAKEWFDNYIGFDDDLIDECWSSKLEEETETSPIVHKKTDGSYLVQSDSGDGYTAFNKDNVCQGHISASNETEAKNKFNSNKFDE